MTTTTTAKQFDTEAIASILDEFYAVRRWQAGRIQIKVTACIFNAVDFLRSQGINAVSRMGEDGWEILV